MRRVRGTPPSLRPPPRDEAYRIGREALTNAMKHARVARVEVELGYTSAGLRLVVGGDGRGIAARRVEQQREQHRPPPGANGREVAGPGRPAEATLAAANAGEEAE
jgi:hypothetical protein